MKVIRVEQIFDKLFDTVPQLKDSNKLFFGYGEQKELNAILLNSVQDSKYPMLWYNLPNTLDAREQYAEGTFEFVLAHNTKLDWFNDQRFDKVFNDILFPQFSLVMQALKGADNIDLFELSPNVFYRYTNLPNFGNPMTFEGKKENKQVDKWDAMKFTVKLRVNNRNCDFCDMTYDLTNL